MILHHASPRSSPDHHNPRHQKQPWKFPPPSVPVERLRTPVGGFLPSARTTGSRDQNRAPNWHSGVRNTNTPPDGPLIDQDWVTPIKTNRSTGVVTTDRNDDSFWMCQMPSRKLSLRTAPPPPLPHKGQALPWTHPVCIGTTPVTPPPIPYTNRTNTTANGTAGITTLDGYFQQAHGRNNGSPTAAAATTATTTTPTTTMTTAAIAPSPNLPVHSFLPVNVNATPPLKSTLSTATEWGYPLTHEPEEQYHGLDRGRNRCHNTTTIAGEDGDKNDRNDNNNNNDDDDDDDDDDDPYGDCIDCARSSNSSSNTSSSSSTSATPHGADIKKNCYECGILGATPLPRSLYTEDLVSGLVARSSSVQTFVSTSMESGTSQPPLSLAPLDPHNVIKTIPTKTHTTVERKYASTPLSYQLQLPRWNAASLASLGTILEGSDGEQEPNEQEELANVKRICMSVLRGHKRLTIHLDKLEQQHEQQRKETKEQVAAWYRAVTEQLEDQHRQQLQGQLQGLQQQPDENRRMGSPNDPNLTDMETQARFQSMKRQFEHWQLRAEHSLGAESRQHWAMITDRLDAFEQRLDRWEEEYHNERIRLLERTWSPSTDSSFSSSSSPSPSHSSLKSLRITKLASREESTSASSTSTDGGTRSSIANGSCCSSAESSERLLCKRPDGVLILPTLTRTAAKSSAHPATSNTLHSPFHRRSFVFLRDSMTGGSRREQEDSRFLLMDDSLHLQRQHDDDDNDDDADADCRIRDGNGRSVLVQHSRAKPIVWKHWRLLLCQI